MAHLFYRFNAKNTYQEEFVPDGSRHTLPLFIPFYVTFKVISTHNYEKGPSVGGAKQANNEKNHLPHIRKQNLACLTGAPCGAQTHTPPEKVGR